MPEAIGLKEARERFEARTLAGGGSSGSGDSRYPLQDEAEERILAAVHSLITSLTAPGERLSDVESVHTGERTQDVPVNPHIWLQDGEVRAYDGTLAATKYEMDFTIRAFVTDYSDPNAGQRAARKLATRVRDELLKSRGRERRLNLNFVDSIEPWRSQRMGEVNENTYAHYSAVRIRFTAKE